MLLTPQGFVCFSCGFFLPYVADITSFLSGAVFRPCNAAKDGHKPVKRRVLRGVKE